MKYDYEKLDCLKKQRRAKYSEMWLEKDNYKRTKLQLEIKILDTKIAIEKLKQNKPRPGRGS